MQPNSAPFMMQLPVLIFFVLAFYFMLIRPQQKKQKDHQTMIAAISKNDELVTIGGVHGTVVNVKDKTFVLRVDDSTKMEIDKTAVSYLKRKRDDKEK